MKIYLLNPPFVPNFVRCGRWQGAAARSGGLDYPKWLAYATGVLEENFDVRLVDAPARKLKKDDTIKDAKSFSPDLVVVDSNFSSLSNDVGVVASLKEYTGATTVLVGPPTSQFPDEILKNNGVDIVAKFEYDFTLRYVAEAINDGKDLKEIKGISYKENDKIYHNPNREFTSSKDLDKIPFVSKVYKKHLNVNDYFLSQSLFPEVQIFAGRGCPNKCSFCSWPVTLMGRKYRSRSAANIANEFEWITENLKKVKEIFIEDDTFTINKKLVMALCNEIKSRKIDITWSCNTRANLNYEIMKEMKDAGCRLIIVGYESGDDGILKNIDKGLTTNQMREFTKDAKRANLLVHGDFIIGLPRETKETAEKTLSFIKELKPNMLQMAIASPIPGTEFYDWARENGYLLNDNLEFSLDEEGFQKCTISYPDFTKKDIETYVDRILREYYLSPSFIPVAMKNILRKNGLHELRGMIMSARIFFKYMGRKAKSISSD